jgi:hypothetical protein
MVMKLKDDPIYFTSILFKTHQSSDKQFNLSKQITKQMNEQTTQNKSSFKKKQTMNKASKQTNIINPSMLHNSKATKQLKSQKEQHKRNIPCNPHRLKTPL